MRLAIGLAALVGAALAWDHLVSNSTDSMKIPRYIPGAYVVEFSDGHDNESFYGALSSSGITVDPRMHMNYTVFNGASFRVTDVVNEKQHVAMILAMSAVKQLWPVRRYQIPDLVSATNMSTPKNSAGSIDFIMDEQANSTGQSYSPHAMTQVDRLHAKGYTGTGIRVGIIDTGVDYLHPALGGCFGKECLIEYGYDLVGDSWTGGDAPNPDPDPYDDCIGHGTHVSGIIAAQKNRLNFTGAAPGAKLGMYKVFACESFGTTDDVLISAFAMAFEDGSDIITASIGGAGGWSENPWSVVVSRIVSEGVPCTLAAGNDGLEGLFTASNAADGIGVTAAASFDNIKTPGFLPRGTYTTSSSVKHAAHDAAFAWLPGYPYFSNITLPLKALSSNASVQNDACSSLPVDTHDLSEYVVLIRLGGCEAAVKTKNAQAFNARAILFYADTADNFAEFELDAEEFESIDATAVVTSAQGIKFVNLLNTEAKVNLTFVDPYYAENVLVQVTNSLTGGFASYYTSWGPTWELASYPSVAAPGGNILSTYLLNEGGYAVFSGTSMATPFVAAVYALLMQARGIKRNPEELAKIVSSTARANLWNDGSGVLKALAPTAQQGSGLIQAYDAAFATTLLDSTGVSFNDTDNPPSNVTFVIQNIGSETVTYRISHSPALSMYALSADSDEVGELPNTILTGTAEVEFSEELVNIAPNGRAEITVNLVPPHGDFVDDGLLPVYGGYFVVNGSNSENLTIPYLGVAGSMKTAEVLDWDQSGMLDQTTDATFAVPFPTINNTGNPYFVKKNTSKAYFVENDQYPWFGAELMLGTRMLRADVVPLSRNYSGPTTTVAGSKIAGSVWGYPVEYLGRIPEYIAFTGLLADGTTVPQGQYALDVRVLSIFGDPEEAGDWQSMRSAPFDLTYRKENDAKPSPVMRWRN